MTPGENLADSLSALNETGKQGSQAEMIRQWSEDATREIEPLVRSRYPLVVVDTLKEDRGRELRRPNEEYRPREHLPHIRRQPARSGGEGPA